MTVGIYLLLIVQIMKTQLPGLQVTQFQVTGSWNDSQYKEVLELCMGGCAQLDAVARQCLQQASTAT